MPSRRREHRPSSEQGFRHHRGRRSVGRDADAPSRTLNSLSRGANGWGPGDASRGREECIRQQQPLSTRIAVSSAEAGFMTARDTARNMHTAGGCETDGFSSAVEPDLKTAREMHTARGFETDDFLSAVEQTPRWREDGLDSLGDAPAYGCPSHRDNTWTTPMHGSGTSAWGLCNTGRTPDKRGKWQMEGPQANGDRHQDNGYFEDQTRPGSGKSTANTSTRGRFSEQHDGGGQHQQLTKRQVGGTNQKYSHGSGGHEEQYIAGHAQQRVVEDIFSFARHNRVEDLERMMDQGVPVDVRDSHGNTVLIVACQNGHKRALKAALRHGANPNAINSRGNTGLHFCHAFGYGDTLGRYLMSKGADASIRNISGLVCYDGIGR